MSFRVSLSHSVTPLLFNSPSSSPIPLSLPPFLPFPEEKYSREVHIIPVDFSDGQEIYPRIAEELQDLDIGLLGKVPSFLVTP